MERPAFCFINATGISVPPVEPRNRKIKPNPRPKITDPVIAESSKSFGGR